MSEPLKMDAVAPVQNAEYFLAKAREMEEARVQECDQKIKAILAEYGLALTPLPQQFGYQRVR